MENINLDFLSPFSGIAASNADIGSDLDLTGSSGLSFSDMLKAAASDIPSSEAIKNAADSNIPDDPNKEPISSQAKGWGFLVTPDNISSDIIDGAVSNIFDFGKTFTAGSLYKQLYSQFFERLNSASDDTLGTSSDYLNIIAKTLNCTVPDYADVTSLAQWDNSGADLKNLLNSQIASIFSSISTDPKARLMFTERYSFDGENNTEALAILDGMADVIDEGLVTSDTSLLDIIDDLTACVNLISDKLDDYSDNTNAMAEMLISLTYALNGANMNSYNDSETDKAIVMNVENNVRNTLENISQMLSVFAGSDNFDGISLHDLLSEVEEFVKYVDVKVDDTYVSGLNITDAANQLDNINAANASEDTDVDEDISAQFEFDFFNLQGLTVPDTKDTIALAKSDIDSIQTQVTEQVSSKIIESAGKDGVSEMTIILKPERLGEVAVKIISDKGAVSIMLSAQHEAVGNAINERLNSLVDGLKGQNIEVKNVFVVNPSEAGSQMGLDFTNDGFNHRESDNEAYNDSDTSTEIIADDEAGEISVESDYMIREAKLWAQV